MCSSPDLSCVVLWSTEVFLANANAQGQKGSASEMILMEHADPREPGTNRFSARVPIPAVQRSWHACTVN
jgi:hypothetical protein